MDDREGRQEALRRIVRRGGVLTQRELVDGLGELGFSCSQGTVSRDAARLGLHRLPGGAYVLDCDLHLANLLATKVRSVTAAGNLVVVRCECDAAPDVARAFDSCGFDEVVGTVAGVDTVLAVCVSAEAAHGLETLDDRLPWPYAPAEGRAGERPANN